MWDKEKSQTLQPDEAEFQSWLFDDKVSLGKLMCEPVLWIQIVR